MAVILSDPSIRARILHQTIEFAQQCFEGAAKSSQQSLAEYTAGLVQGSDAGKSLNDFRALIEQGFEVRPVPDSDTYAYTCMCIYLSQFLVSDVQITASRSLLRLVQARPQLFAPVYAQR